MSTEILFGCSDYPADVNRIWYEQCTDGHRAVIYVAGLLTDRGALVSGGCPVCAARQAVGPIPNAEDKP